MTALPLDADEQIVRINKMQMETNKMLAETIKLQLDSTKVLAETYWLPYQAVFAGLLAGAALLGAGAALAKLFLG